MDLVRRCGLLLVILFSVDAFAQSDLTMTQLRSHTSLVAGPSAQSTDYTRAIRFMTSPEVTIPMQANHNAIERALQVYGDPMASNEARQAARESIRRSGERLNVYSGLINALNGKLGAANVTARMTTALGRAPMSFSQNVTSVLNSLRTMGRAEFQQNLRARFGNRGNSVAPRPRGAPQQIPDVLDPGGARP